MYIGYMQILCHFTQKHRWILVSEGVLEPLLLGYQRMTLSDLQTKCANINRRALIQEQQFKQPCLCYECTCAYMFSCTHTQTPFFCTSAHAHTHTILLCMCTHTHPILLHTHPILLHARMHTHTYTDTHTILLCTHTHHSFAHTHTPHSFVHTHHSFACSQTHPILLNRFPIGHIFAIFCYCLLFVEMSLN